MRKQEMVIANLRNNFISLHNKNLCRGKSENDKRKNIISSFQNSKNKINNINIVKFPYIYNNYYTKYYFENTI